MRLAGAFATGFSHLHVPSCLLSPPGSGPPILPPPTPPAHQGLSLELRGLGLRTQQGPLVYSGCAGAGWQKTSGHTLVPVPTELPEAWSVGGDS